RIFTGESLRASAAIIRIRRTGRRVILTYKRRVPSEADVKTQIEHEVEVSDASIAASILAELGLKPWLLYEKHRDTWKFKSVEIVLDELPFGLFMEIEGPVADIREAEALLGIEGLEVEHETYPAMTARLGNKVGDVTEARFSSTKQ
ncbi:MAG TPA: class IV adenylate cyclase, partial [Pyrinomonadaceae bacterium]|nr:class IV adenylate cyclase [Pyrinomonadaceae bacterium]